MTKKYLITSALPYGNGPIHLGHMLEHIQTDIWVKFLRLQNCEVIYICADDAHGAPILIKAQKDKVVLAKHENNFVALGLIDNFIFHPKKLLIT